MAQDVEVGQASLRDGAARADSPRIRAVDQPHDRPTLGSLYLVVQGETDRQCAAFGDAVVSAYYADDSSGVVNGLMRGMRQAVDAAAVGAGGLARASRAPGATSVVIGGDSLHIAQLAPSQAYVLRGGVLNALPDDNAASPAPGADLDPAQEVDLFRVQLDPGDVVALGSTHLRRGLTGREIRGLLQDRAADRAAADICSLLGQRGETQCDVLVLRVAPQPQPAAAASALQPHPHAQAEPEPASAVDRSQQRAPAAGVHQPGRPPPFDPAPAPRRAPPRSFVQRLAMLPLLLLLLPVMALRGLWRLVTRRSAAPSDRLPPAGAQDELPGDQDWDSLRQLRQAGPGAAAPPSAPPPAQRAAAPPQADPFISPVGPSLSAGRDPFLTRRRRSLPGLGTALFVVSLVLLVVMVGVLVLRNNESAAVTSEPDPTASPAAGETGAAAPIGGEARANQLFADAEARYREALDRAPDANRSATLLMLRDAKDTANQALTADVNRVLAPDLNRLLSQIGREEDRLNRVRKLVPSATIGEFDSAGVGSSVEPLDARGESKFVIDATTGRVVEFTTAKQGATVVRKGDVVSSITIQTPIAVINRALSMLVFDDRYNLVSLQADQNPRLLRIVGTEAWRAPVAFDNFNNNLYVLDPGANQIHKYQGTAGGYEIAPTSYAAPGEEIDLSQAIDFAIDGDVFVLLADGQILRLRGGRKLSFDITGLDGDDPEPNRIFTEVETDSLYLVDAPNSRVVEIDKREDTAGAFVRQFKYAGSDDFFADIRAIWVSEIDGRLVVLGKDSIRQFVLPTVPDEETTP